ncbi:NF038130 family PEP-CTERM protein [Nostocales cyanobacterium LEGE 11386]|nr:NF038130 family PEP-CTERM protein [Nostocales cyanobacterium LEGE 11386]
MKKIFQTLMIGTAMAVGVSAATLPAQAGSLTGANIGGSASQDFYVYDSNSTQTFKVENPTANDIQRVLDGNAASPTGNIELRASSEAAGFDFTKNTTLAGTINGKNLTLSSLTLDDWTGSYQGTTFGQYWFNQALSANGFGSLVGTTMGQGLFATFVSNGGFQRFSDPNISYVNQDDTSGLISIGLAGHFDASNLLLGVVPNYLRPLLAGRVIQASEIVKYTYEGKTDYLFSFQATNSGLTEKSDGVSHSGNYEVYIQGVPPTSVPEPSIILGLLGFAGIFAAQRQVKKVSG